MKPTESSRVNVFPPLICFLIGFILATSYLKGQVGVAKDKLEEAERIKDGLALQKDIDHSLRRQLRELSAKYSTEENVAKTALASAKAKYSAEENRANAALASARMSTRRRSAMVASMKHYARPVPVKQTPVQVAVTRPGAQYASLSKTQTVQPTDPVRTRPASTYGVWTLRQVGDPTATPPATRATWVLVGASVMVVPAPDGSLRVVRGKSTEETADPFKDTTQSMRYPPVVQRPPERARGGQ